MIPAILLLISIILTAAAAVACALESYTATVALAAFGLALSGGPLWVIFTDSITNPYRKD
jgi:hypothetical protein